MQTKGKIIVLKGRKSGGLNILSRESKKSFLGGKELEIWLCVYQGKSLIFVFSGERAKFWYRF